MAKELYERWIEATDSTVWELPAQEEKREAVVSIQLASAAKSWRQGIYHHDQIVHPNPYFAAWQAVAEYFTIFIDTGLNILKDFQPELANLFLFEKVEKKNGEEIRTPQAVKGTGATTIVRRTLPMAKDPESLAELAPFAALEEIEVGRTAKLHQLAEKTRPLFRGNKEVGQIIDLISSLLASAATGYLSWTLASHFALIAAGEEAAFPSARNRLSGQNAVALALAQAAQAVRLTEVEKAQHALTQSRLAPTYPISLNDRTAFGIFYFDDSLVPDTAFVGNALDLSPGINLFRPKNGSLFLAAKLLGKDAYKKLGTQAPSAWDPLLVGCLRPCSGFGQSDLKILESQLTLLMPIAGSEELRALLIPEHFWPKQSLNGRDRQTVVGRMRRAKGRFLGKVPDAGCAWASPRLALRPDGTWKIGLPMMMADQGSFTPYTFTGLCPTPEGKIVYAICDITGDQVIEVGEFDGLLPVLRGHEAMAKRLYVQQKTGTIKGLGEWRQAMRQVMSTDVVDVIIELLIRAHGSKIGFCSQTQQSNQDSTLWQKIINLQQWSQLWEAVSSRAVRERLPGPLEVSPWLVFSYCAVCGAKNPKAKSDGEGKKPKRKPEEVKIKFSMKQGSFHCQPCEDAGLDYYTNLWENAAVNAARQARIGHVRQQKARARGEQERREKALRA